jgi:hypothetical protein
MGRERVKLTVKVLNRYKTGRAPQRLGLRKQY